MFGNANIYSSFPYHRESDFIKEPEQFPSDVALLLSLKSPYFDQLLHEIDYFTYVQDVLQV